MDLLNTTIAIAQKASQTLQFPDKIKDATTKLERSTLTRIMTSDSMIRAHYPTISTGGANFIKDQFSKFYKHANIVSDELLTLNDGITVLQFTAQTFYDAEHEALLQQQQRHQQLQQQQQQMQSDVNINNNNNSNNNNNNNNNQFDQIDEFERNNKKSEPLTNSSNDTQAPFWKRQRHTSVSNERNTNSLQDTMANNYPDHEISITEKVNEAWHSQYCELHNKYNNMIELQVSKLRYINSELPFDNKYDVPLRDRIKSICNRYLDTKRNKYSENVDHNDNNNPKNDIQNDDTNNPNSNDNDNTNNHRSCGSTSANGLNQCNDMEYDSDCVQTELKHNQHQNDDDDYEPDYGHQNHSSKQGNVDCLSNLDKLLERNNLKMQQFNQEMNDQQLLSNILVPCWKIHIKMDNHIAFHPTIIKFSGKHLLLTLMQ